MKRFQKSQKQINLYLRTFYYLRTFKNNYYKLLQTNTKIYTVLRTM